jgi:hypothetical protein
VPDFPWRLVYYNNDKFVIKIDRVRDTIHDTGKLPGLPVPHVPFPGAPFVRVRRGHQEVMPPWPKEFGSQT